MKNDFDVYSAIFAGDSMVFEMVSRAWMSRAKAWERKYPDRSVGRRTGDVGVVPCGDGGEISVEALGVNNPGCGNCLYHAVWMGARLAGVQRPFGMSNAENVYILRVIVALRVKQLMDDNKIEDPYRDGSLRVADLIAQPDQYQFYSGQVPLLAMACLLQRKIVTLCADGVFAVTECIEPVDVVLDEPVVIYHCCAQRPGKKVDFGRRDHYVAIDFRNVVDRRRFYVDMSRHLEMEVRRRKRPASGVASDLRAVKKVKSPGPHLRNKLVERVPNKLAPAKKRRAGVVDSDQFPARKKRASRETSGKSLSMKLSSLISRATTLSVVDESELALLRANFTKHPKLALLYFHCCSCDPEAYVSNDERLNGPEGEKVVERLERVLDKPVDMENVERCQKRIAQSDADGGDLWACASCCEMLNTVEDDVHFVEIEDLHCNFKLTADEKRELVGLPNTIVENHFQVFCGANGLLYHLNPDLISDGSKIVLCRQCNTDPRKVAFSIASGHDYGRWGALPELNDVATKCIAPVRSFGLTIVASGKHAIGHSICFPSSGPKECSRVLPCTDMDCIPRVTFIGPREEWRAQKKKFKRLYELPVKSMYSWLRVLMSTHEFFKEAGIKVDEADATKEALLKLEREIEGNVDIIMSGESCNIEDAVISERFGVDYGDGEIDEVVVSKTAVLKAVDGLKATVTNVAIDAMLDLMGTKENPPVVVRRAEEPRTEWDENGEMIAGAFPCLFMRGGKALPRRTWPTAFIRHLMAYYDGRFEKNTMLVATIFNQLQRHTAVRRAARIGTARAGALEKLGDLANSEDFRALLVKAKTNPKSLKAKRLNGYLLRILSLVGGSVPFSPFERATTRPKLSAMRARFGVAQHWVTVAPPEHHNLELHRIAMLREQRGWNQHSETYHRKECSYQDLPESIRSGARGMLSVSNMYPALAARVFERCISRIHNDIIMCSPTTDTRISRDYGQRQSGAYGAVAGFAGVIEPQVDGRLHIHMALYGSKYSPELLTRIACSVPLRGYAEKWLNSVCCTNFDESVHEWRQSCLARNGFLPKSFEVDLPRYDCCNFQDFIQAAQMRAAVTNFHAHSSTCFKGRRGKYMCRLARPAGVHEGNTCPLIVTRDRLGDMEKGISPIVTARKISVDVSGTIDKGYKVGKGEAFRSHGEGPLLWELRRSSSDVHVVETNLLLAALTCSHTNSSIINGEDSGDMVDEYQQAYMTKDDAALKSAASALHSALMHNIKFPSRANDSGSSLRTGQYLATRTINSFSGAHEWSHSLMVHAITGHRSFICSESFWYVFPFSFVEYVKCLKSGGRLNEQDAGCNDFSGEKDPEIELSKIVELTNLEDASKSDSCSSGVRRFTVGEKIIFLTQAESYYHRGENFAEFTPMEFECIVDVLPAKPLSKRGGKPGRGRPARTGFPFASSHPLYETHHGYLRAKMMTPVLGGPPPPTWSNASSNCHDENQNTLARYLMSTFTVWAADGPPCSFDAIGLLKMCNKWDRSNASLIDRQRCRFIRNIMKKGFRSSRNEQIATDWRNRNVDYWKSAEPRQVHRPRCTTVDKDPEFDGSIPNQSDLYKLLCGAATGSSSRRLDIASLKEMFESLLLMEESSEQRGSGKASHAHIFPFDSKGKLGVLARVAIGVQTYERENNSEGETYSDPDLDKAKNEAWLGGNDIQIAPCNLSNEQFTAVNEILSNVGNDGRPKQSLILVHGGGGTGKSFMVRRVCEELKRRHYKVVATCPTGAGACQLQNGMTFHSALKCGGKNRHGRVSAKASEFLRQLFGPTVVLVIVDEISMLKAKFMVLLDERLRELYDPDKPFGGKSVALTGDFWQLPVVKGVSLCRAMYTRSTDPVLQKAKQLFSLFRVFKLSQQQRASECAIQQAILEKFRAVPELYPEQQYWSKDDADFHPIDDEIVEAITRPLTKDDISADKGWLDDATILVTSNMDRAVLNACMGKMLAVEGNQLLFRWRKTLVTEVPEAVVQLVYNEKEHPELFGYFFYNAPGQILDNANGNVTLGAANGTRCWYHSLGWDDEKLTADAMRLAEQALDQGSPMVDLPFPPQFINVQLADRDGSPVSVADWPSGLSLTCSGIHNDESAGEGSVIIPIGYVLSNADHYSIELKDSGGFSQTIKYAQHAVDLAMVLTVWKAQGGTFGHVILLLEGSTNAPSWQFEHVYVAASRVKLAGMLRCLPLSPMYNRKKLYNLRPSVFTIKWFMDIGEDGMWRPHADK